MTFAEAAMIMMGGGKSGVIKPLNITKNGKYTAADYGCDGFDPVDTNIPDRYEEGVTDGRQSLIDYENGVAPSKEIETPNGTLVIDNAIEEANLDTAISVMLTSGGYVSGNPNDQNIIYSLFIDTKTYVDEGTTTDNVMLNAIQMWEDGTPHEWTHRILITQPNDRYAKRSITSLSYDPSNRIMSYTEVNVRKDGVVETFHGQVDCSTIAYALNTLLNGTTIGGLPHVA